MCFLQLESGVNTLEETGTVGENFGVGGGGKVGKGPNRSYVCMYIEANFPAGGT